MKVLNNEFIFIFENEIELLPKYLEIANDLISQKKIIQFDKETNNVIKIFDSIQQATTELNISTNGVSQCCNYYKYTDETRPKCYKLKSFKGFIFKFKSDTCQ